MPITYRLMASTDVETVAKLFADTSMQEPLAVLFHATYADLYAYGYAYATAVVQDMTKNDETCNLCYVACSGLRVVGVFLCQSFLMAQKIDIPGLRPIAQYLQRLYDQSTYCRHICSTQSISPRVIHLSCVGVDSSFAKRGIARELFVRCLERARALKYDYAVVECTSVYSRKIALDLHFWVDQWCTYDTCLAKSSSGKEICNIHNGCALMWCNIPSPSPPTSPMQNEQPVLNNVPAACISCS
jgi:ribosomal protein S18 acetylase RimI-like enzyme